MIIRSEGDLCRLIWCLVTGSFRFRAALQAANFYAPASAQCPAPQVAEAVRSHQYRLACVDRPVQSDAQCPERNDAMSQNRKNHGIDLTASDLKYAYEPPAPRGLVECLILSADDEFGANDRRNLQA